MALIAVTARVRTLYGDFSGRSDARFRPCLALDKSWISLRRAGWGSWMPAVLIKKPARF